MVVEFISFLNVLAEAFVDRVVDFVIDGDVLGFQFVVEMCLFGICWGEAFVVGFKLLVFGVDLISLKVWKSVLVFIIDF